MDLLALTARQTGAATMLGCMLALACAGATAAGNIELCHAGVITLPSFERHIAELRATKRFSPEQLSALVARNRKGGADFFSSQVIVQDDISGSGTFDLRLFHGLSSADTKYRNVTAWACEREDYPIVYFVGFRVRAIEPPNIFVSREKDIVNVISLKGLDAALDKHTRVKLFQQETVLCADLAHGCSDGIFYHRHD